MKKLLSSFILVTIIGYLSIEVVANDEMQMGEIKNIEVYEPSLKNNRYPSMCNEVMSEALLLDHYKEIKQGIFQAFHHLENDRTFISYTWERIDDCIKIIDETIFNDQTERGYENGAFYFNLWKENERFFLSFRDLEISYDFLDEAKKGMAPVSMAKLGMDQEELIELVGEPNVIDWYKGGKLLHYSDIGYIFDDQEKLVAIMLPGYRFKISLVDVEDTLHTPDDILIDPLGEVTTYVYRTGNFQLLFEADNMQQKIESIMLVYN